MVVCEGSATSSGPTKFPITICTRRLGVQVSIWRSRNAGLVGWDMYYECRQREYPRLPLGGHRQAKGKGEDPKPPGERQLKLNLSELGLSWGEAQAIAKDKTRRKRDIVAALSRPHLGQQGLMMMMIQPE